MCELKENYLLAKFGEEEHIRQLQEGKIFFNAIQAYRNDETTYRGDSMEGKIPIDPKTIAIYEKDENNIFDKVPYPDVVTQSFSGDEGLKMFCAALIDTGIMDDLGNDEWAFKEEFKEAVKDFGEYVLIFWSAELLENIKNTRDETGQKILYDAGRILYRDFTDFEHTEEYRTTGSDLDIYFVKSLMYKMQNEWRIIIDGENEALKANCGVGLILQTLPFKYSRIMKASEFLNAKLTIKSMKK